MKHNIMKNLTINFEAFFTGICIEKTHSHHYYVSDSDLEWVTPSLVVAKGQLKASLIVARFLVLYKIV